MLISFPFILFLWPLFLLVFLFFFLQRCTFCSTRLRARSCCRHTLCFAYISIFILSFLFIFFVSSFHEILPRWTELPHLPARRRRRTVRLHRALNGPSNTSPPPPLTPLRKKTNRPSPKKGLAPVRAEGALANEQRHPAAATPDPGAQAPAHAGGRPQPNQQVRKKPTTRAACRTPFSSDDLSFAGLFRFRW